MATELSRVASAAIRSVPAAAAAGRGGAASRTSGARASPSLLFGAPASSYARPPSASSITCALRSLGIGAGKPAPATQKRQATDWASPARAPRPSFGQRQQDASATDAAAAAAAAEKPAGSTSTDPLLRPTISGFGNNRHAGRAFPADADPDYKIAPLGNLGGAAGGDDYTWAPGELSKTGYGDEEALKPKRNLIRCVPRTGRTTYVSKGADVARAFRLVDIHCFTNRVRADVQRQKFHERPGLKRKRLKSERWQRKFKLGFKATCNRVQELRKQGW